MDDCETSLPLLDLVQVFVASHMHRCIQTSQGEGGPHIRSVIQVRHSTFACHDISIVTRGLSAGISGRLFEFDISHLSARASLEGGVRMGGPTRCTTMSHA